MRRYTFSDIPGLVGEEFVSDWVVVDQRRMEQFDESTFYDPEEYGWDVESFPEDLVEGYHLLALLPYLVNSVSRLDDPRAFALNYGLDRVRFVTPVYAGERLRARGVVTAVEAKGEGYVVAQDVTVEVEGRERPGFTAQTRALVLPHVPDDL